MQGVWEFTVKYYDGAIATEKRARKVLKLTRAELMPMLVTIEDTQQPVEEQQSQNNENARTEHEQQ